MKKLALLGGNPIRKDPFPSFPVMGEEEINAVTAVMRKGNLSGFHKNFLGGPTVQQFENDFADYMGVKHAISINSGTAALHIAIAALGIRPGDEVIVPAYTFSGSATSILHHNAIPIFADINPRTFNLSPESIKSKITNRTKALIVVHLYGQPADMDEIIEISKEHNIPVIEDNAQSPGACYKSKQAGSIAEFGTFSFQETKNIMTGEGGMTITNDNKLAEHAQLVRNHGELCFLGKPRAYITNFLGWNYRMTEIEAAVGIEQLKRLDTLNDIRKKNAAYLDQALSEIESLSIPYRQNNRDHVYHMYQLIYDDNQTGVTRETIKKAIEAEGIPIWPGNNKPLYDNPLFLNQSAYGDRGCPFSCSFYENKINYKTGLCPETEKVCESAITLSHIRPPAGKNEMKSIVDSFEKVFSQIESLRDFEHNQ